MTRTVVMLHGAFAGPWCFERFGPAFEARGWRVLTPALRHHDRPGTMADDILAGIGLGDYADDLAAAIGDLEAPPVLLGHSLGGLLAQLLAARGLAAATVLLAPAAPWGILPSSEQEVRAARGLMALGPFWERPLSPVFEVAAADSLVCLAPGEQRRVFDRFGPESGRALFETLFWMFDESRAAHVRDLDVACPVLCIAGERDLVISSATVARIAEKYREVATLMTFAECGHMLVLEDGWRQVADACLDWLEEQKLLPAVARPA